jgi:acyl dehydratase
VGSILMTRDAVIEFASRYDPQPFHLSDEAAAANPIFGRLAASGWHTAVMMQMLVSEFTKHLGLHGLAGGGVDALRWIKPVFPPERLLVSVGFDAVRPSKTQPDRGIATMRVVAAREGDEAVAELVITGIFAR